MMVAQILLSISMKKLSILAVLLVAISACGGGGSSSSDPAAPAPQPTPAPPPTNEQLFSASRLASMSTFGVTFEGIEEIATAGNEAWLDTQLNMPATYTQGIVDDFVRRREQGEFEDVEEDIEFLIVFRRYAWWHLAMTAPDMVRQRMALALSEILVVSDNVDELLVDPYALSGYFDMLVSHAFGNFRDLLKDVAQHPSMGVYLSHANNARSDPENNIFPDENFAREVMQLFSIGLFELNIDGSHTLDDEGNSIPTYTNIEIREFAKIFTGFSFGGSDSYFGNEEPYFQTPMVMFDEEHEPGSKGLLNNKVVPGGQTGMQDFEDAIDNLFNHANVGPFIGHLLIQRLVTSNPTPGYIERVARAFNGDNTGVRGDMRAVVRAILLDPEASNPDSAAEFGRLREPMLRHLALAKHFNANSTNGSFFNDGFALNYIVQQHPLSSPSVFNFFLPAHTPQGVLAERGLVAPEFEITTANTIVGITNLVAAAVYSNYIMDTEGDFGTVTLDFSDYVALAADADALIDRLDLVLTYGTLSSETRELIKDTIEQITDDDEFRTEIAIYLFMISPDYAVQA